MFQCDDCPNIEKWDQGLKTCEKIICRRCQVFQNKDIEYKCQCTAWTKENVREIYLMQRNFKPVLCSDCKCEIVVN